MKTQTTATHEYRAAFNTSLWLMQDVLDQFWGDGWSARHALRCESFHKFNPTADLVTDYETFPQEVR